MLVILNKVKNLNYYKETSFLSMIILNLRLETHNP